MREIKFRAWHKKRKKIYTVLELRLEGQDDEGGFAKLNSPDNQLCFTPIKRVALMQYVGLKDINGKEIFEDDILLTSHTPNVRVYWDDLDGRWAGEYINSSTQPCCINDSVKYTSEVIGNVHENPELLKREG